MLEHFPQAGGDALIYGGLAKNILLHGQYAFSDGNNAAHETLIRLPGYPLFLALCFRLFGMENYWAAGCVQIALELLGCLLLARFVRRIAPPSHQSGAAMATLWLAALCPFTAYYAGAPLTETLTLFAITLALWSMARFHARPGWGDALAFTFAVTLAAMLRPDGALVGVALAPALLAGLEGGMVSRRRLSSMAVVCLLLALAPFAAWTWRNWSVFHVFQPLAPRYANDPGETCYPGWQRWYKTWSLDFASTYDIYWNMPGGPLDLSKLPARAFDSPAEYAETAALAEAYESNGRDITPQMDAPFGSLAERRIASHPLRYYLWLPLGRMADMWLRPRIDTVYDNLNWWDYAAHPRETRISWACVALNAAYLLLAAGGLWLVRPKYGLAMVAYLVVRSALLMTIEAPETRYTLEGFPMLFALSGMAVYWLLYVGLGSVLKVKASLGRV